jgi:hypothetical protein
MNLFNQVENALKWKRSDNDTAQKLGIPLKKYRTLKQQVVNSKKAKELDEKHGNKDKVIEFKEDIEAGTAEIKGISFSEPKSAEEIIKILKIDTKKWKLSSYRNKETNSRWLVSATVTAIKQEPKDYLAEVIKSFKPDYQAVTKIHVNNTYTNQCVGVISTQDLHFGKEGNNDITKEFKEAITNLAYRAYSSHSLDKIIYVIGGDLLNMDTFSGTTTSGTPVDNAARAQEAYKEAFDALYWSISFLKQFCLELHIVYLPGNHDRLSSFHMAHALSKCFNQSDIIFDAEYKERKVVTYGNNFFGFEHGDVTKKNTALVYATEFAKEWGNTIYRVCFTGHFHSKKTIEYVTENEHNGFSIKHLPSLSSTDYWHYHMKYTGSKRQAILEVYDKIKGKIGEFIHTV